MGDGEPEESGAAGPVCRRCGERISERELFGVSDGTALCEFCLDDEWDALTAEEKFEILGFETRGS